MNAVLTAEGLKKSFGAVTAAANISLAFDANTVVSLIGANGAGKTTFLNMVTGYLKPDSGRIMFDRRNIVGLSPRQITKLGVSRSFQVPQLFQTLNVRDNLLIAESIAGAKDPQAATDAALARFALEPYGHQQAGLLPEGIRKLLDVAMALSSRSKLLLLDEPTSSVSADEKFAIMDVVMGAARAAGVTVIFVEHDMDIVARFAGRVVAFYDGGIIADGTPDTVLRADSVRRYVIGDEVPHAAA
ncbi:ABC transporter ATP-binding protein [Bradyrhizobium centrolobii]|uniref:ABC transporter ATP-binding protein n=1 Tax=Bradyrhizobium centrolobii TaxID=1505087 RepID=A0A176YA08_9BRAD|nr:ATP-binding cassette domain-containing protein [Bradyrhizobium centrolobii]OAE99613.1 ABC transporter ATP-binding protein [Bradyrhizobium centrolobii]